MHDAVPCDKSKVVKNFLGEKYSIDGHGK